MYSPKIESLLKSKNISIGDQVKVEKGGKVYEGLLLPKTDVGDPSVLVIKLQSGYNMGIDAEGIAITKSKEKTQNQFGKVQKDLLKMDFSPSKPPISLVSCGGTIASRVDYKTGGVYAAEDPKEFLHNIPELAGIVNLKHIVKPINKMSEDMGYKDWITIAKAVHDEIKKGVKGVIVTHGTDTMHYTSAALSFFLRNLSVPVVLVGSQKSSDRGGSDAGMNLICAAHLSVCDIAEVGICMHATMNDSSCFFLRGTKVRKMHTIRRDAFRPINDMPIARLTPDGKIDVLQSYKKRSSEETVLDSRFEPKIALLKVYPSSDPDVMEYYIKKGVKGFVIEGTGLGHVPTAAEKSWIPPIKKAVKDGIPVVVTSQTIYGRVNPAVYTNLRVLYHEAKAIPGEDMLTEVAYVKLGWVLGHTQKREEVEKEMHANYAGELTERSLPESFLF